MVEKLTKELLYPVKEIEKCGPKSTSDFERHFSIRNNVFTISRLRIKKKQNLNRLDLSECLVRIKWEKEKERKDMIKKCGRDGVIQMGLATQLQ